MSDHFPPQNRLLLKRPEFLFSVITEKVQVYISDVSQQRRVQSGAAFWSYHSVTPHVEITFLGSRTLREQTIHGVSHTTWVNVYTLAFRDSRDQQTGGIELGDDNMIIWIFTSMDGLVITSSAGCKSLLGAIEILSPTTTHRSTVAHKEEMPEDCKLRGSLR